VNLALPALLVQKYLTTRTKSTNTDAEGGLLHDPYFFLTSFLYFFMVGLQNAVRRGMRVDFFMSSRSFLCLFLFLVGLQNAVRRGMRVDFFLRTLVTASS
jgi:uncharacterized membrane protein